MQFFDADTVARRLPYAPLIDALDEAFRRSAVVPQRAHHTIGIDDGTDATLLLMPAWRDGGGLGVKIATFYPDNRHIGAVQASYLLLDGDSGAPRALIDGGELTLRRTAAASALASRYLSNPDAATLLMVGTGNLAPHLIAAHSAIRPIERVLVWGRTAAKADALTARVSTDIDAEVAGDLQAGVQDADIVSCATLAIEPLIRGEWLRGGQHLDLVGAFTPDMREADSAALARSTVVVDTYEGGLSEAGDIVQAIADGTISDADIAADLAQLARGERPGRQASDEITLFKSVGTALEDLAAAEMVAAD